ncbi:NUDIX domain-containing protein [Cellulophaga baltica]|uniref:NUDIX hydrolase n=1 Tax=Cellulophaga TaxID=104264 RepID=UPI001C06E45D|nr:MULTISPECIES: NUDIX domain-containing protein [Cellulophaga]MBU2997446.1 NUDIX domain-containing protein [Cellulophaga baltica]MDO6768843.1 NUDIX domain-containing protein [Cellulophaga sp. 1_MG-2023]
MDELIDIYNADRITTGKTVLKSIAHKNGWFHQTVHIWFYTSDRKILVQQRGKHKSVFPLLWDVSVAGHIGAGEKIEDAAIREIEEEIGLQVNFNDLKKIGIFKSEHKHSETLIDREFHHTFIVKLQTQLKQLIKQESEVEALALTPLLKFSEETWGLANPKKYVPHSTDYYKTVIKAIKKEL